MSLPLVKLSTRTNNILTKKVQYNSEKPLHFKFEINEEEWNSIKPTTVQWKDRTTLVLQQTWTNLVLDKIWAQYKLECPFPMHSHKFFKMKGYPYLQFHGKCGECGAPIKGQIIDEPNGYPISVVIDTFDTREIVHVHSRQLRNNKRDSAKEQLKNMKAIKYKHLHANKFLNNSGSYRSNSHERPNLNSTAVLNKIRQEAKNPNEDCSNVIAMLVQMSTTCSYIRGFSTIPFVVYYWHKNQIDFWHEAAQVNPVISLDASGRFTKAIPIIENQKTTPIFFYNIVVRILGHVYTISQMLSSKHDVVQIVAWLSKWLDSIDVKPAEIVVDCSIPSLNAICIVFNHCTYIENENQCIKYLTQNPDGMKMNKVKLPVHNIKRDRAHLLKASAIWKCFGGDNWIKKDLYLRIIGFSLEIEELDLLNDVVIFLFIVCQSQFESVAYQEAFGFLEKAIRTFDYNMKYSDNKKCHDCSQENCHICKETDTIKEDTLLLEKDSHGNEAKKYILNLKMKADEKMLKSANHNGVPNDYFLPGIVGNLIILYSQFPAWTNVMHKFYSYDPKKVSTSCGSEIYYRISRVDYGFSTPTSIKHFLPQQMSHIEGATKLGRRTLKLLFNQQTNENSVETEKNENYTIVNGILVKKYKCTSENSLQKSFQIEETKSTPQNDAEDDSTVARHIQQMFSVEYTYLVIMKEFIYNLPYISEIKCTLTLEHFQSLRPRQLVHGNVIDSFLAIQSKKWHNISYIPTSQTIFMVGERWHASHGESWSMYHLDYHFTGILFLPYCSGLHWMLLVLDFDDETITFYDPHIPKTTLRRATAEQAFSRFLRKSSKNNFLKSKRWKWRQPSLALSFQRDSTSCGLFVMYYMNVIAGTDVENTPYSMPENYRLFIANLLYNEGDANVDVCLYCFNVDKDQFDGGITSCQKCCRWAHEECIYRSKTKLQNSKCCELC